MAASVLASRRRCDAARGGAISRPPQIAKRGVATCLVRSGNRTGETNLTWAEGAGLSLLTLGLDHLTLARAALYAAMQRGEPPPAEHVNAAVDILRRAGAQHHLPGGLLTRALYRTVTGDLDGAREDLDEAFEIAERGPMRLHLADIRLHRARLFGLSLRRPPAYPWTSPRADLAEARKLIETCGYGRRLGELEDAEAALRALSPAAP
jgi:hypothetical protein